MRFLFVCIGNSCRSQIAEAIAKDLGYNAVSAGTKPAKNVHKNALLALFYKGISISNIILIFSVLALTFSLILLKRH